MCVRQTIALLVLFFGMAAPLDASVASASSERPSKLALYDWSVNASPSLGSKPPSMKILVNFLNSVLEAAGEPDPNIGMSASDSERANYVCSFRFADLRSNGSLSLVVGLGVPDRPSC